MINLDSNSLDPYVNSWTVVQLKCLHIFLLTNDPEVIRALRKSWQQTLGAMLVVVVNGLKLAGHGDLVNAWIGHSCEGRYLGS